MNLCVLGNSHAAALKTGLGLLDAHESERLRVTFFASAGQTLKALEARDGVLRPARARVAHNVARSSEGAALIDPAAYDAFLIHGLAPGCCYELFSPTHYSVALVEACTVEAWQAALGSRLHAELRKLTDKPILHSPQPLLGELAARFRRAHGSSPSRPADMVRVFERLLTAWGPGTGFVAQPAQTVVQGVFTAGMYCTGSTRLARPDRDAGLAHGPNDARHMNARYGACVWREVLGALPTPRQRGASLPCPAAA